ncbi:hypothetical protein M2324_004039 [Rhodovulum sulfidophilum]|uniref:HNH endonuclease signature motif containing protein n=1 Tax=Rhodovulum sulfidophilum TaxID=35806 RepID=UPI0005A8907B|nr:HNH endonuclease signature motif containing protein [Rhodovulum sulfidophilum]ANB33901.1 hypothetical protein A6W98_07340 [Rhodovulum sulfidophilum DSM 1374]ANB37723.1 hypothetical protein A6024_07195 [Rhodovulum sulfidophilum]MCW2305612.1 hypothetical protein [Rhodovulum sulfidophilum]
MAQEKNEFFAREASCIYQDEEYRVRDNGAVFRCSRIEKRKRPLDEVWTFGTASKSDGYMTISSHKIHRIVATAFLGAQPTKHHVVDHIDTNRRNNRPENLRWVTRLENILLNPITAKRVEYLYGSIEDFLADPRTPRNGTLSQDFEWMRTVSPAEAEYSRKRMLAWAQSDRPSQGGTLGDWIFGRGVVREPEPVEELVASKTPNAVQRNWRIPAEFPLCPDPNDENPLAVYFERLKEGEVFAISSFGQTKVAKAALSAYRAAVYVMGEHEEGAIKPWSLAAVTLEAGNFVHESCGTFFTLEGAEKEFTLIQGLQWEGGETFDDYC